MRPQLILPLCAAGVIAKNPLGYMVDYGRCHWENFLGNFENQFCEYSPSALDEVSIAVPKQEESLRPVATPFVPPAPNIPEEPDEQLIQEAEEEVTAPIIPPAPKEDVSEVKSDKYLTQELWEVAGPCAMSHNRTEEYCVYADDGFAGGRGITILTTPTEALKIAKSPAFTQTDLYKTVNNFNAPGSDKWHVEEIPHKGMGLVASRNLLTGDHIMSVSAAIMTDFNIWDHVNVDQVRRMQAHGISYLPKYHQNIFMNLSTHDAFESHEEQVYKIILTNAFDISDIEILDRPKGEKGENFFTVFPEGMWPLLYHTRYYEQH